MNIDPIAWMLLGIIAIWAVLKIVNSLRRAGRAPLYCSRCGTLAKSKQVTRGSGGIEILLWLCFILPGVIYTLWRASSKFETCPACGALDLIPTSSPKAREALARGSLR